MFVQGNGRQYFPLVGLMHGHYPVVRLSTNQDYVVRSNGLPLYHEQDVALPGSGRSAALAKNPSARPMTAAAFIQKIRMIPPAADTPQLER